MVGAARLWHERGFHNARPEGKIMFFRAGNQQECTGFLLGRAYYFIFGRNHGSESKLRVGGKPFHPLIADPKTVSFKMHKPQPDFRP